MLILLSGSHLSRAETLNERDENHIEEHRAGESAYAGRYRGLVAYAENSDDLSTLGVSKLWFGQNEMMKAEIGISVSQLHFKRAPSDFDRTFYFPVYGIFHIQPNYAIAPYIELGLDLGDVIISNVGSENKEICCDVNLSAGIEATIFNRISLSAYGKFYQIRYLPSDDTVSDGKRLVFVPLAFGIKLSFWY